MSLAVRLSRCVCVRRISLSGEGNALYPVLSSWINAHGFYFSSVKSIFSFYVLD